MAGRPCTESSTCQSPSPGSGGDAMGSIGAGRVEPARCAGTTDAIPQPSGDVRGGAPPTLGCVPPPVTQIRITAPEQTSTLTNAILLTACGGRFFRTSLTPGPGGAGPPQSTSGGRCRVANAVSYTHLTLP